MRPQGLVLNSVAMMVIGNAAFAQDVTTEVATMKTSERIEI
jgi:hypothetical protein